MAQTAIQQAIYRAARVAGLVPDSWTVILSVPYPGVTIYGDSLSAMVSLRYRPSRREKPSLSTE